MSEYAVRVATPQDRASVVDLIHLLHDENGLFSLSDRKVEQQLDRYYKGGTAILGVIGPIGAVEGSIFLSIEEPYYSEDLQLTELWNMVHPAHRTKDHVGKLLDFAKRCSDETQLTLMIGIISNKRTAAKLRIYGKKLEPAGGFFVWNPQFAGGHWLSAAE